MNLTKEEIQYLIECVHQDCQLAKQFSGREDKSKEMVRKLQGMLQENLVIKEVVFNWDGTRKEKDMERK